jgi:hypothetical protein
MFQNCVLVINYERLFLFLELLMFGLQTKGKLQQGFS